jgi:hypothetical protein
MSQNLSRNLKRAGASVAAVFALGGAFNSQAHVHKGSVLDGYQGFVNEMHRPDGMSCCHLRDGQGNLKEEVYRGEDGKQHYRVTVTKDLDGKDLPEPVVVEIPDHAILTEEYAQGYCAKLKKDTPDHPSAATCVRPPFNVLWTNDYYKGADGKFKPGSIYCYIPTPKAF